jgi:hypothetical protein
MDHEAVFKAYSGPGNAEVRSCDIGDFKQILSILTFAIDAGKRCPCTAMSSMRTQ